MRIDLVTLFPEMCEAVLAESIVGRGRKRGAVQIVPHQLRSYAHDRHSTVDDTVFGGGKGMLLLAEPIAACFDDLTRTLGEKPHIIFMSPQGRPLNQKLLKELNGYENLCILCGHYEGVDERVLETYVDEEVSLGDFVLTGGELPALCLIDSLARLQPGVLAAAECYQEESHYNGLLEYPQYSRPQVWRGKSVPPQLMTGHHANIACWRRQQSLLRTLHKRPDMLQSAPLTPADRAFLQQYMEQCKDGE
ncbi:MULTISPECIES: tRNA (guanosine(37)-N1)-methyltransferase TrmD [Caproicibacterium]|jgi:tRNA (guanine37-N1)-methyltransferase|uniref:tRNA (guanine-N(1)-)-methyltransferase n=1 Tax=Caproicibacterium lactatifermentans TaxID=2666138 RepID=A0A859DT90_9FIRM|nr:tRNA (guanosine(37)-N1)-methyltransferase TrmD [Caproicibacterium lactatifermentans]ARP50879.1 tRNA (guanosine(37)-N1)-methyltransferase TrmD [Ruminococcaceae bacterium CPB6]MDD4807512.1 tRNA (guanosine(37)-N1)-methyltransferase TrmD [Oscillospiraceae bacterium]QKN23393.1 tRNA (guanosine(37)-N1)-methyltransferase TrmD [Caproicibacterium lactatifermentans]QKO29929.1 tRNA (guanosine(37)-N1)-methyltransferase TrmD [Caproicibacterium lactatifermentans]